MTTKNLPEPGSPDLVALDWTGVDACTLPTAERPFRLAEFDNLFATHLRSVDRLDKTHARLVLHPEQETDRAVEVPGLAARVQELADAETACCSFFTFTVTATKAPTEPAAVHLDMAVPAAYIGVLDGLLDLAHASCRGDQGEAS